MFRSDPQNETMRVENGARHGTGHNWLRFIKFKNDTNFTLM